jgi:DNA polymerase-3 subunit alpha
MNALYRPGPLAEIPRFIVGKNNPGSVRYLHMSLEPILHDTYGVMVYQEQIIQLLQLVAGYSAGEADLVRKAIGKKKRDIMEAEEPKFIKGCVKQGLTETQAHTLWKQIQPFADYSFNKAHATCYAQIGYWTAYLKAHYPAAFMAALMTSDFDDTDRLAIEIAECKHMGIDVLAPDVNESFVEFAVVPETDQVRFGMAAIKNVGTGAVEEILRARVADGKFETLEDFFSRVNTRVVNRKALESLVKTGAFDSFGERGYLLHNLDLMLAYGSRIQKELASGQTDLFGNLIETTVKPKLVLAKYEAALNNQELLQWERELLGLYISQHPLEAFDTFLSENSVPINTIKPEHDNKTVTVGGVIQDSREITTKNGQKMAFVKLADQFGETELILFPSVYQQAGDIMVRDRVILAKGKVAAKDKSGNLTGEPKVLANEVRAITHEEAAAYKSTGKKKKAPSPGKTAQAAIAKPAGELPPRLYIRLARSDDQLTLISLKEMIDKYKGETEVVLVVGPDNTKQIIRLPMRISSNDESLSRLNELVGADNVKLH